MELLVFHEDLRGFKADFLLLHSDGLLHDSKGLGHHADLLFLLHETGLSRSQGL